MNRYRGRNGFVLASAFALVLALVVATAFGAGTKNQSAADPIKIAGFEGTVAQGGPDFMNGMKVAEHLINKSGGIMGRKVEVKIYQTGGTPEGAAAAYRAAAKDGAIGSFHGAAGALAIRSLSTSVRLPAITASGNDKIDIPVTKYMFSNSPGKEYATSVIVYATKKLKKRSFSVLHYDTDFSSQIAPSVKARCAQLKCKILDVESASAGASIDQVTPQLTKMRSKNPDAYYIESLNPNAMQAARQLGMFNKPVIAEQWLVVPALAAACGKNCERVVFAGHKCALTVRGVLAAADPMRKFCNDYIRDFKALFPKLPFQLFSVYGRDAVYTYAAAATKVLKAGKDLTPDNVAAAMEQFNGDLFTSHGKVRTSAKSHRLTGTWTEAYIDMTIKMKGKTPTWVLAPKADRKGSTP